LVITQEKKEAEEIMGEIAYRDGQMCGNAKRCVAEWQPGNTALLQQRLTESIPDYRALSNKGCQYFRDFYAGIADELERTKDKRPETRWYY
jgi:diaminopimelate epimerase